MTGAPASAKARLRCGFRNRPAVPRIRLEAAGNRRAGKPTPCHVAPEGGAIPRWAGASAGQEMAVKELITILQFSLPVFIAIATLEALFLGFVMRRNYNWRAYLASLADALGREY